MSTCCENSDRGVLELLRQFGSLGVQDIGQHLGVTATAVRQRLDRLTAAGHLQRLEYRQARGRPAHRYQLTDLGLRQLGHNLADLAKILWTEVQQIPDRNIRRQLMKRVSARMAELYGSNLGAESINDLDDNDAAERLESVARVLRNNRYRAEVESRGGALPILKINGCPYPDLSGTDHEICEVETAMLNEMVGREMTLTQCRCDTRDGSCSFEFASREAT